MTPDERDLLQRTANSVEDMNRALFEVPPGSPPDERPLIEGLRVMWRAYQRGNWLARLLIWIIPTAAGLLMGWETLKGWATTWTK